APQRRRLSGARQRGELLRPAALKASSKLRCCVSWTLKRWAFSVGHCCRIASLAPEDDEQTISRAPVPRWRQLPADPIRYPETAWFHLRDRIFGRGESTGATDRRTRINPGQPIFTAN